MAPAPKELWKEREEIFCPIPSILFPAQVPMIFLFERAAQTEALKLSLREKGFDPEILIKQVPQRIGSEACGEILLGFRIPVSAGGLLIPRQDNNSWFGVLAEAIKMQVQTEGETKEPLTRIIKDFGIEMIAGASVEDPSFPWRVEIRYPRGDFWGHWGARDSILLFLNQGHNLDDVTATGFIPEKNWQEIKKQITLVLVRPDSADLTKLCYSSLKQKWANDVMAMDRLTENEAKSQLLEMNSTLFVLTFA